MEEDQDDLQLRSHANSVTSMSSSDGEHLLGTSQEFDDICNENDDIMSTENEDLSGGVLSDSEPTDLEDFAYYQDVYRFVGLMKNEFEKRKPTVDWDTIQRKKKEVEEAVKESKERIRMKSREKIDAGKRKIRKLQKKTYRKLKKLEPEEDYRMKIIFTKSVLTLVLKTFATCSGQWLLPWYYAFTCPCLIIWRVITYWQSQWQYFCLDFCYFGNLVILLILWLAPASRELCCLQFSIANGMLYLGAFSFRNSLVFHSVDKMTSTYIHTVPLLLTYGIRWFPAETSRFWHSSFPEEALEPSWKWNVLAPFMVLVFHTIFYTILVNVILKPEEHIVTSFRYLKGKASVKKVFGPNPPYIVFVITNFVLCIVFSTLTMVFYQSFFANTLGLCTLLVYVTWNGAGYYFDVFRMSMVRKINLEKQE